MKGTSENSHPREGSKRTLPTRTRKSLKSENELSNKEISKNLPPPRRSRAIKPVSPPLSKSSFNKFIYALIFVILFLSTIYGYRLLQTVGSGWWNLVTTWKRPIPGPTVHNMGSGPVEQERPYRDECPETCYKDGGSVEAHINGLAHILGMTSTDLARAIAGAAKHFAPPASLSSLAAKETGDAVKILIGENDVKNKDLKPETEASHGVFDVVEDVIETLEDFVGMDVP